MRLIVIIMFLLTSSCLAFGQDGSNISYVKPRELDKSYIGRICQIDFYRDSYRGTKIDKITLEIDKKPVEFIEHRADNGYNQWFFEQYLESVNAINGKRLQINKFKLLNFDKNNITVLGYFNEEPLTREFRFKRSDIFNLLFKNETHNN